MRTLQALRSQETDVKSWGGSVSYDRDVFWALVSAPCVGSDRPLLNIQR